MRSVKDRDREPRAAVFTGDGPRLVEALSQELWKVRLELVGDGLVDALAHRVEGVQQLARLCVAELRDRAWSCDSDLADQLDSALGKGPAPLLRPLIPVTRDLFVALLLRGGALDGRGVQWCRMR